MKASIKLHRRYFAPISSLFMFFDWRNEFLGALLTGRQKRITGRHFVFRASLESVELSLLFSHRCSHCSFGKARSLDSMRQPGSQTNCESQLVAARAWEYCRSASPISATQTGEERRKCKCRNMCYSSLMHQLTKVSYSCLLYTSDAADE